MGGPTGQVLRPRITPEPTPYVQPHSLVIDHREHQIRAWCPRECDPGQWRSGVDAYEDIKADFDKQHDGGKR